MSLDGFIEGPNGEVDWCKVDDDPVSASGTDTFFDQLLSGIDTIFYGRVSYDLWGQYQPDVSASEEEKKLWRGVHSKAKYVFSNEPRQDDKAIFVTGDLFSQVRKIKSVPGKNIWLYGGANLITSFINAGLVDNYQLAVHPVILGGGKPLFTNIKSRSNLTLNKVTSSTKTGVVLLDYHAQREL